MSPIKTDFLSIEQATGTFLKAGTKPRVSIEAAESADSFQQILAGKQEEAQDSFHIVISPLLVFALILSQPFSFFNPARESMGNGLLQSVTSVTYFAMTAGRLGCVFLLLSPRDAAGRPGGRPLQGICRFLLTGSLRHGGLPPRRREPRRADDIHPYVSPVPLKLKTQN